MDDTSSLKKVLVGRINLYRSQLKASARASALLAGFAMVALVEIQVDRNEAKPLPWLLLTAFSVNTALLIGTHMVALMISTFLLPIIESYMSPTSMATPALMQAEKDSIESLYRYVLTSWFLSTVVGICLFLLEIPLICWMKFWNYSSPSGLVMSLEHGPFVAFVTTFIIIPIFVIFIFVSSRFYREIVNMHMETTSEEMRSVEQMLQDLPEMKTPGTKHIMKDLDRSSFAIPNSEHKQNDRSSGLDTLVIDSEHGDPASVAMLRFTGIRDDFARRRQTSLDDSLRSE